ncbi:MAG: response regulator [Paenibacillus sp.]|nr:response regulator [Paenibacillus sp.]
MRLLIIDDEMIIRTGIQQVIDWPALGIEALLPAASAEEALERIPDELPHIVLTDIRMSGMDGLELASILHQQYPEMEIIILSGYDEFSYVQQAMREGVSDYLLKTSRPEEIIKTMLKSKQRITDRIEKHKRGSLGDSALRTQLLEQLIKEGISESSLLAQAVDSFQLEMPSGYDQIIILNADGWEDLSLLLFAIHNILEETLSCHTLVYADHMVILLRSPSAMDQQGRIQQLLERLEGMLKCTIFAALGTNASHYSEWPKSYSAAKEAFMYRMITGNRGLIAFHAVQNRTGGRTVCSLEEEAELSSILVKGNRAELHGWVHQKIGAQLADDQVTTESLQAYIQSIIISGYRFIERMGNSQLLGQHGALPPLRDLQQSLNASPEQLLYEACSSLMDSYRQQSSEHRGNSYVEQAIVFIRNHLHTGITLQQVAREVHLNPNHFSEVFKRETGQNYIDFVTRERIERAAEILKNSEMKISQVARAVGYEDMKYFSQLFKKFTCMTPSEFRSESQSN